MGCAATPQAFSSTIFGIGCPSHRYSKCAAIMAALERDSLTASKSQAPRLSPEDRERAHRMTLKRYVAEPATWPPGMGPRPGEPGCIISADVLAEFNIHSAQAV